MSSSPVISRKLQKILGFSLLHSKAVGAEGSPGLKHPSAWALRCFWHTCSSLSSRFVLRSQQLPPVLSVSWNHQNNLLSFTTMSNAGFLLLMENCISLKCKFWRRVIFTSFIPQVSQRLYSLCLIMDWLMPKGVFHWLPQILDRSQGAAMQGEMQQLLNLTGWCCRTSGGALSAWIKHRKLSGLGLTPGAAGAWRWLWAESLESNVDLMTPSKAVPVASDWAWDVLKAEGTQRRAQGHGCAPGVSMGLGLGGWVRREVLFDAHLSHCVGRGNEAWCFWGERGKGSKLMP